MKREILEQALNEISDRHIAEAAGKKKRMPVSWIGSVAAALAVVILCISILRPISNVKAISEAEYPEYQWEYKRYRAATKIRPTPPSICTWPCV